jgi:hypothetical protein
MNYDHEMGAIRGANPAQNNAGVAVPPMPRQGTDNPNKE